MFINGILTNIEVRHGLKEEHITSLEQIDEYLLRKILKTGSKAPKESLYLECGAIPIRYMVKSRRLNYLHHLLTRKDKELISKIYNAQKDKPIKDDWYLSVQKDKEDLQINLTDSQIKHTKKQKFKSIVKEKCKRSAFNDLIKIKSQHSKGKEAEYKELRPQKYIKCKELTKNQKTLLYNLRFRMTDAKMNFKNMYIDTTCSLCKMEDDSIQHYLECSVLIENCTELFNDCIVRYEDIYGSLKKQTRAAKLFEKVLRKRKELIEKVSV